MSHNLHSPPGHLSPPLKSAMRHSRPSSPIRPSAIPLQDATLTSSAATITKATHGAVSAPIVGDGPPSAYSDAPSEAITPLMETASLASGMASPPPSFGRLPHTTTTSSLSTPVGYTPKVAFDTLENPINDALFSFTLQVKSEGYKRTRKTRVFLCAASPDETGTEALDWAIESLVQDDDEFIVVRGFDTGELDKDHETLREEARELLKTIADKNVEVDPNRKLSIVVEYVAGKITETIEKMIALYRPDSMIVGTRGERGFLTQVGQAIGTKIGSVSKYCLSHSPVPVIVVSPHRRQAMEKRRADPKRQTQYEQLKTTHGVPMRHAATTGP